jgi:hypothetical protein
MTAPRNITDPLERLLVAASPGGIEASEAQGQRELVASTVVPTDLLRSTKADYEALGFVFGDVVAGDPLFQNVTLPSGWTREGSDHAMWSYICDETGRKRVAVFYKAAFYDRKAHMSLDQVPQEDER